MNIRTDLHTHTYYSDGVMSPEELVASAKRNGVAILAVTDHDNMLGCDRVEKACKESGIHFVRGLEISAYAGDLKVHMLGYNVDYTDVHYKAYYEACIEGSKKRAEDILVKLNANRIEISLDEVVRELYTPEQPIHASHIARAAVKKGYAQNPWEFYMAWLNRGKPAYSNICRPTPQDALQVIHACGGFCSLAHPGRLAIARDEQVTLVNALKRDGLDGIEACYSTHTTGDTAFYKELAAKLDLLVTGGSDTHSLTGNRKVGTPFFEPSEALLKKLNFEG